VVLTAGLTALGVALYRQRSMTSARRVFLASVIYLPLLTALMVADRQPRTGPVIDDGRAALVDPSAIASISWSRDH
jgi:hypothetical protein